MARLSKPTVEAAKIRPAEYLLWDGDIAGFGLRMSPSGRKAYLVACRFAALAVVAGASSVWKRQLN